MSYLGPVGFSQWKLRNACEFHGDSYISNTPSVSASDLQTATISSWFRRARWGTHEVILMAYASSVSNTGLSIDASNRLEFQIWAGSYTVRLISTSGILNNNDWHHVVVRLDLSNAVQAERARIYLDGNEVTYATSTRPANDTSDAEGLFENNTHYIGSNQGPSAYFRGILADVNLVQGQSLAPSEFGKDFEGSWVWKDYTGSHGSNGLRLKFDNPSDLAENSAT